MIPVRCPNASCPTSFDVPDDFAGKTVMCANCRTKFQVHAPAPVKKTEPRFAPTNGKPKMPPPQPAVLPGPILPVSAPPSPPAPRPRTRPSTPDPEPNFPATAIQPALDFGFASRQEPVRDEPANDAFDDEFRDLIAPKKKNRSLLVWIALGGGLAAVGVILGIVLFLITGGTNRTEVYGGIDISSNESKVFVYRFTSDPTEGFDFELLNRDKFMKQNCPLECDAAGDFTPASMTQTAKILESQIASIQKDYNVARDKIVLLAGPGVSERIREKAKAMNLGDEALKNLIEANFESLKRVVSKETGLILQFADEARELDLQIKSMIPEKHKLDAVVIDMGSSGTRGGSIIQDPKDPKATKVLTFKALGVKQVYNGIEPIAKQLGWKGGANNADRSIWIQTSQANINAIFREPFLKAFHADLKENTREVLGRKHIEIVGGVPYVVATYVNPADQERTRRPLTFDGIMGFYGKFREARDFPRFEPPPKLDERLKAQAQADVSRIERNDKLNPERVIVGTDMLKVISEQFRFEDPNRSVVFNNHGMQAAVLGLMQELWLNESKVVAKN